MAPLPGTSGADADGKLSRAKIINETKWCVYCCCEGWGLGPFSDPLIAAEVKQLCIRSSSSTTDLMGSDGLCHNTSVMLCLTSQFQLPPVKDAPKVMCCNKKLLGGSFGSVEWPSESKLFEQKIMDDTFWLYYCCCSGNGLNKMDQGIYSAQFKQLCCRGYTNIEPPTVDGVCCSQVNTTLCLWGECQMPPAKPNPTIALCTWRMNKETHGGPEQVQMK